MTAMQGNRHHAWASDALENEANAEGSYLNPQEAALRTAIIEATLALAFEQRTANLIAYLNWVDTHEVQGITIATYEDAANQIQERLGLK